MARSFQLRQFKPSETGLRALRAKRLCVLRVDTTAKIATTERAKPKPPSFQDPLEVIKTVCKRDQVITA